MLSINSGEIDPDPTRWACWCRRIAVCFRENAGALQISTPASDTLDTRWSLRGAVADTIDTRWSLRAPAFDTLTVRWNVSTSLNDSLDIRWRVVQPLPPADIEIVGELVTQWFAVMARRYETELADGRRWTPGDIVRHFNTDEIRGHF